MILRRFAAGEDALLLGFAALVRRRGLVLACDLAPADLAALGPGLPDARRQPA